MKLLFFDFSLPFLIKDANHPIGGAAVELYAWIKGLLANHCRVGVLTWKGAKKFINRSLKFDLVETYDLNKGFPKLKWIYKRIPCVVKAIRNYEPDWLIQECAGLETGIIGLASIRLGIPFLYRVANDIDADGRYKQSLTAIQQAAYKYGLDKANAIFCQNTYQYRNFMKKYPQKYICIIPNPYHCDFELPRIESHTARQYIAWIGIFQYQKNLPVLLKIAKSLPGIKFKIAGKRRSVLDDDTKNALEELKRCRNVSFIGYITRKEISPFLAKAYALLNTSHYEGFSNTFLEAFAAGTPVITTSKVDPNNIIKDNNLGLVAEEYDEFPKMVYYLINDKNYADIAQRCRNYVIENHNPELLAQKFIRSLMISIADSRC